MTNHSSNSSVEEDTSDTSFDGSFCSDSSAESSEASSPSDFLFVHGQKAGEAQASEEDRQASEEDRHVYKLTTAKDWESSNDQYIAEIMGEKIQLYDSLTEAHDKLSAWESYWRKMYGESLPPVEFVMDRSEYAAQQEDLCYKEMIRLKSENKKLRKVALTLHNDIRWIMTCFFITFMFLYSTTFTSQQETSTPCGDHQETVCIDQSVYQKFMRRTDGGNTSERLGKMMLDERKMKLEILMAKRIINSGDCPIGSSYLRKSEEDESRQRPDIESRVRAISKAVNRTLQEYRTLPSVELFQVKKDSVVKANAELDALFEEYAKEKTKAMASYRVIKLKAIIEGENEEQIHSELFAAETDASAKDLFYKNVERKVILLAKQNVQFYYNNANGNAATRATAVKHLKILFENLSLVKIAMGKTETEARSEALAEMKAVGGFLF